MARGLSKNRQPAKAMSGGSATDSVPEARSKQQIASKAVRSFGAELLCAGAVFFVALFLYSWTLAPAVTLTDSGELIVVAHALGVAHPVGFWCLRLRLARACSWRSPGRSGLMRPSPRFILSTRCSSSLSSF